MARTATVAFVVVLVAVALLPLRAYLTKPREVIVSTPSAYTGAPAPIGLAEGSEACADEILFAADGEVARFGATAPAGAEAPRLEVVAAGRGYRSVAEVTGGWSAARQLDVALTPPRRDTFGTFCVQNLGPGTIELAGNENGRAFSRPTLRVDGEVSENDLPLRFLEAEPSSLLARAGAVMANAATLRPLGAWWWWVMGLAVLALAPIGVVLAMRSALVADAAVAARAPVRPGVMAGVVRLQRLGQRVPGWALLAAGVTLAGLWFLYWGINTHVFQDDEDQYVYLSRWLQNDFPATLWNFEVYGRGLQRLEVWLLAIPAALVDSPWSLAGGRFLNTVAFVSTAVPVFLLGRGMGLRPQWAALPAVLSVAVPWAVVTTAFLTENVAYPACLWVIWAVWRATVAPAWWRDLLALVLIVVAGASRSALLVLAPVLPAVVLATGLRCGAGRLAARPGTVLREHVLLWVVVAVAALPLLLAPLGIDTADALTERLAGGYPSRIDLDVGAFLEKVESYVSRIVIGTAFLPAAVGLPWLADSLLRSRDRVRFAFAAVVLLASAALFYSLGPAGADERYILYLAPLVLLPAALAVARRELSPAGVAIASVLLAVLLLRVSWNGEQGPFGFFVSPVEMFYARAVGLRLATYLPGDGDDALALVAIGLGLAGVALAAALRWAPARLAGVPGRVLVGAVAAFVLLQTHYTLTKYVNGAGSKAAAGLDERAFADRAVPRGERIGTFAEGVGLMPEFLPIWQEVQFYNQQIDTVYTFGPPTLEVPPGDALVPGVTHDARTGRLRSPAPLPDHVVVTTHFGSVGLRGEVVAAPAYVAAALVRVAQPAALAWASSGFAPYGVLPEDAEGGIRFFGAGLPARRHCATLTLIAPPDAATRFRVEHEGRTVRGTVDPTARRDVTLPLPALAERGFADVAVRGERVQVLAARVDERC